MIAEMTLQEKRQMLYAGNKAKSNMIIEVKLFPVVKELYPEAELVIREHVTLINLEFKDEETGIYLNAHISREAITSGGYTPYGSRKYALKVKYSCNCPFSMQSEFNKRCKGSRLRTDIIDEKFDAKKVIAAIDQMVEFWKEAIKYKKSKNSYETSKQNKLDMVNKELFGGEAHVSAYDNKVIQGNTSVWGGHIDDKVSISTGAVSIDQAKKILAILNE